MPVRGRPLKQILLAAFFLASMATARGQIIIYPNLGVYGVGYNRLDAINTLWLPTGCGAPVGSASLNAPGQKPRRSALYADTCGKHIYWYVPGDSTWQRIDTGGGGSGTVTAVILSHDSLYYVTGSGNTFVSLIVTQADSTVLYVTPTQLTAALATKLSAISTQFSVTGLGTPGSPVQLVGDVNAPGNSYYYGTNGSGAKGFYVIPAGVTSANPSQTISGSVVNGSATTFMRSDGAPAIASNAVTNTLLAQAPTNTIKGNNTGGTANEADLTVAQINAMLGLDTVLGHTTALATIYRLYKVADSLAGLSINLNVYRQGAPGDTAVSAVSGQLAIAAQRDSSGMGVHHTINPDFSWTWYGSVFGTSVQGMAPASGGGTVNYLRADGTWAAPITLPLSIANGGTGAATAAANTTFGNPAGSTGAPSFMTATQATANLNIFTTSLNGLVPTPASALGATYFLNAAGGWTAPAGGGGLSSFASPNSTINVTGSLTDPRVDVNPAPTNIQSLINGATESIGQIINQSSFSSTTGYLDSGGVSPTFSGGGMIMTNGSATYTKTIALNSTNSAHTCLPQYRESIVLVPTSTNTGAFIGTQSTNSFAANDFYGIIDFTGTGTDGTIKIVGTSSHTVLATGTSRLTYSANDHIIATLERNLNSFTFSVVDETTGSAIDSVTYVVPTATATGASLPNTGRFAFGSLATTPNLTIDSFAVSSYAPKYAQLMIIGDSKSAGYDASSFPTSWMYRLGQNFRSVFYGGAPSDRCDDIIARMAEFTAYPAQYTLLSIGRNNIAQTGYGDSTTVKLQYQYIVTTLTAAGTIVYHLAPFYETTISQSWFVNWLYRTYSASTIINTYAATDFAGLLGTDNVHPNDGGQGQVYKTIMSSFLLPTATNPSAFSGLTYYSVPVNNVLVSDGNNSYTTLAAMPMAVSSSGFIVGGTTPSSVSNATSITAKGSTYGTLFLGSGTGFAVLTGDVSGDMYFATSIAGSVTNYGVRSGAGRFIFGGVTDYATAPTQSVSTTLPQFAAHYDATHYATFKVNSSANLDIENLTGLTINSGALPTGTTTDSVLVETTSANVATVKKVAQSSIANSTPFFVQTANGSALTNSTSATALGGTGTGSGGGTTTIPSASLTAGRTIHVHGSFVYSTGATNTTFSIAPLAITATVITLPASQINAVCIYDLDVVIITSGGSGTYVCTGTLTFPGQLTNSTIVLENSTGSSTTTSISTSSGLDFQPYGLWGTASSSNSIQSIAGYTIKVQ